jgi:predicted nucleic acid-binding protein
VSFLLDTSVISELVKKNPRRQVVDWIDGQEESTLFLSALTVGELEKGIAKLPASARKRKLLSWVRRDLAERFGGRLLPIDVRVAARWGAITGESEKRGRPLPVIDSLIAAHWCTIFRSLLATSATSSAVVLPVSISGLIKGCFQT